jgi:hypothetical protein
VWSYPETQESFFDLDQEISSRSEYLVSSDPSDFSYLFESGDVSRYSSQVKMGISNEFEFQIGGEEIEFSLFDIVSFSTRLPSFMWSTKTEYNQSELSTLEITTNNSTQLNGYLNGVPNADELGYDYAVRPFLYWSTSGAMVLDYTTAPEGTFWDNYADPDPAFILPWKNGQCGFDKVEFSRISQRPACRQRGQVITTCRGRNLGYEDNPPPLWLVFRGGLMWRPLGSRRLALRLGHRSSPSASVGTIGMGGRRIYAVIGPLNLLVEVTTRRMRTSTAARLALDMGDGICRYRRRKDCVWGHPL